LYNFIEKSLWFRFWLFVGVKVIKHFLRKYVLIYVHIKGVNYANDEFFLHTSKLGIYF